MDEEAEAIRLQKLQAAGLSEEDFGLGTLLTAAATGKVTSAASTVEKIRRNVGHLSTEEKRKIVETGALSRCLWLATCCLNVLSCP